MDIHAIWSRIDQLEKIVIAQGREIDKLRQLVKSNKSLQPSLCNGLYKDGSQFAQSNHSQILSPFSVQDKHDHSSVGLNEVSSGGYRNSFLMNSFVHPASAVPPFAGWIPESKEVDSGDDISRGGTIFAYPTSNRNSLAISQYQQQVPNRWSVGPRSLISDHPDDRDDNVDELPLEKNANQGLIELMTCFCPCFSMC